jgi:hypothetical protein
MATRLSPVAIGPVNDVFKTFTAFSHGELPAWAWAAAVASNEKPVTFKQERRNVVPIKTLNR